MSAPRAPRPRFKLSIIGLLTGEAEGALGIFCLAAVLIALFLASPEAASRVWSALGWFTSASH